MSSRIIVLFIAAVLLLLAIWFFAMPGFMGRSMMNGGMDMSNDFESGETSQMVQVALPDTFSANAEIGKRIFDVKCAACHGANAAGQNGVAPPLVHKIYEPSHHADIAFLRAAQYGVRSHHWNFGNMPAIEDVTQGDVKLITAYVRELQRANGIN